MARRYLSAALLPFLLTAFLTTGPARAATVEPDVLVKNVTEEVMTILRED